jgi:prophage regulatory protein
MTKKIQTPFIVLRRKQVESRTGLSRSTIYARIAAGTFPKPIDLGGGRAVGWIAAEIDAWINSRIKASREMNQGGE